MNIQAVFHRSECEYAYALDEHTLKIVLRTAAGEKISSIHLLYNNKYDFTKHTDSVELRFFTTDGLFDYYSVDVELSDLRFAYIFKIIAQGVTYYYSEAGLTTYYDFDLAYYTFFQFPFINKSDVVKSIPWTKRAVFYQIFIDRFNRGNFEKDDSYITQEWNEIPRSDSYCGGDLKGITDKLDYLTDTGVNALYLTPVFTAYSNHKYNVREYTTVDPQFGTNDDLKELIRTAHAKGMRIMLDAVFNHCDISNAYFQDVIEKGKKSKYYEWFIIDGDKPDYDAGNYAYFADCKYMPKWNTNNPVVRKYLIGLAKTYVKLGFDGIRLDVADEVSHTMWRELRLAVKAANPDVLIIGELWHENTHCLRGDEFDGVMNYRAHKIFMDYFASAEIDAVTAANRLNRILVQNYEQVNAMMLNFLDNHDTPRFLRWCGGNKNRVLSALAAVMMFPGVPCVFYGTEFPLDGAGDPDCRRTFDWSFMSQDKNYFEHYKRILALKADDCLQNGATCVTERDGLLCISRQTPTARMTALFNNGVERAVTPRGEIVYSHGLLDNNLCPNGTVIFKERL